jgi:hypothetical protein
MPSLVISRCTTTSNLLPRVFIFLQLPKFQFGSLFCIAQQDPDAASIHQGADCSARCMGPSTACKKKEPFTHLMLTDLVVSYSAVFIQLSYLLASSSFNWLCLGTFTGFHLAESGQGKIP